MERYFRPMGLNLRVTTDTQNLADAVAEAYGVFTGGNPNEPAAFDFHFTESANNTAAPVTYRMFPDKAELQMEGQTILSANTKAVGCFPAEFIADRSAFRLHALHFALSAALSARGFLGVHAACIVINGTAILLRSPHGAGKSVLAYAAALRGFQVIAGSTVWIAPDNEAWWGIPRWLYLRPSARNLFPGMPAGPEVQFGNETKIEIDLNQSRMTTAPPGIIVYLQSTSQWHDGAAGNETSAPGYEARIARLLQCPTHTLNPSTGINQTIDQIAALC